MFEVNVDRLHERGKRASEKEKWVVGENIWGFECYCVDCR